MLQGLFSVFDGLAGLWNGSFHGAIRCLRFLMGIDMFLGFRARPAYPRGEAAWEL